ncbi:MAG TPA: sulfurtransferase [Crocinitomicaceae bacterium]|nr:rhodanese-like domain-containing protein [Flavobacteriales bacterium]HBW86936.1 sulfurtransferase [Crocinitomicaceae bacterium]
MSFFSKLFGNSVDYKSIVENGGVIVDVRTTGEYKSGHIKGSLNIPLQNLKAQLNKIPKDKVVITCCASGMRSSSAKSILLANGFKEVHNGGGWSSLSRKI